MIGSAGDGTIWRATSVPVSLLISVAIDTASGDSAVRPSDRAGDLAVAAADAADGDRHVGRGSAGDDRDGLGALELVSPSTTHAYSA